MNTSEKKKKIFLDGCDPAETRKMVALLGFLDGQTTNPTLLALSPTIQTLAQQGRRLTHADLMAAYRQAVEEIAVLVPQGSVSIEVYADASTTADAMLRDARQMHAWIPNAHIKFPMTAGGLAAAAAAVREGMRVNMTLCFSQQQAGAVYTATREAKKGQVFISPFIGRLDDRGENGMDLIANILRMYAEGDGHVEVLAASIRSVDHILASMQLGAEIITAPTKILRVWAGAGRPEPSANWAYAPVGLAAIPYEEITLAKEWGAYNIQHELTDQGIARFAADWNALIGK